jgi:hypothetical protein
MEFEYHLWVCLGTSFSFIILIFCVCVCYLETGSCYVSQTDLKFSVQADLKFMILLSQPTKGGDFLQACATTPGTTSLS